MGRVPRRLQVCLVVVITRPGLRALLRPENFHGMPNDVRLAMVLYSVKYTLEYGPGTLLRSISPPLVLGTGPADINSVEEYYQQPTVASTRRLGDVKAKHEARDMMKQFVPSGKYKPSVADTDMMDSEGVLSGVTPTAPPPSPFI